MPELRRLPFPGRRRQRREARRHGRDPAASGERIDVHRGKYDLQCVDCHRTEHHLIRDRAMAVSVDTANRAECTGCHARQPHTGVRQNARTGRLSCQTRYITGVRIDPARPTNITAPPGSRDAPNAKIRPFKVHRGKQPQDTGNNHFPVPNVHGHRGFRTAFDWKAALQTGAQVSGLLYSGSYDFAPTEMYFPLSHMVTTPDEALQCRDCHGERGRIDRVALGYPGDPLSRLRVTHDPVYLNDADGVPVTESGLPLSVAETCGMCHELDDADFVLPGLSRHRFRLHPRIQRFRGFPHAGPQFYFRELRVLKVMFTAIVHAMLLVVWTSALGLLDYVDIMVKETWLWPGIVGGLVMGVGSILGGYFPAPRW